MITIKHLRSSQIGRRLVISIILFSSVITLLLTSLQIYLDYRNDLKQIRDTEELIRSSYLSSLTNSVWMLNDKQILLQLEGLLRLPNLEYFEILENRQITWSAGRTDSKYSIKMTFPLTQIYDGKVILIGQLVVIAGLDNIYRQLIKKALVILLSNTLKTFIVSGFILFIFYRLVTRHLHQLSGLISILDIERTVQRVSLDRTRRTNESPDELDQIVSAVNQMQIKLNTSYQQLEETNKQLKSEIRVRERIEKALEESRKDFSAMADTSPLAIYMSRGQEQIAEYINPTFTRLFGYTMEEVPTVKEWWPLAYPVEEYRESVSREWNKRVTQAIETNSDIEPMLVSVNCKDGSQKVISWGFSTIGTKSWAFGYDMTDLIKAEEQIRNNLKEKDTLLHEIHHRVKNNMQVIISLLHLQSRSLEDSQAKDILIESQNRVFAMSAVHETLHGSETLSAVDLKSYINMIAVAIVKTYATSNSKIELVNNISAPPITLDQAYPLGLIINELISNAMKYAFPDGRTGKIMIETRETETELELIVSDNGVGMPEGFDWRNSDSLGLKLVRTLVENQLDGTIELNDGNGTKFWIKFCVDPCSS